MNVQDILKRHSHLNFVKRIQDPYIYPNVANNDGSVSTHKMIWGESEGKYVAYPTIVQDETGKLRELGKDEAWNYAKHSGEFIEFDKKEDAETFAGGAYKERWKEPNYQQELF